MKYVVFTEKLKHKKYIIPQGKTLKLVFFGTCSFDLEIKLTGTNSRAEVMGLVVPKPNTDLIVRTHQIHEHPNTKSALLVKSVIPDMSKVNYIGMIRIEKNASLSDAYQKNETMLLGDTARIHTSPILEILNHDVRCTHGATVKPISKEELLYLQSRGIPQSQARGMIVRGFIDDIISQFPDSMQKDIMKGIQIV